MPAYQCTWFFEGVQQNNTGTTASSTVGWTETWYGQFASVEQAIVEMRRGGSVANPSYLSARLPLLAEIYRLVWVRATEVNRPRLTKTAALQGVTVGGANTSLPTTEVGPAQVNCCALVDFVAPPLEGDIKNHHRRFLIRGLPVGLIRGNLMDETSQSFQRLIRFCNYLGRGRAPMPAGNPPPGIWQIKVHDPNLPRVAIESLTFPGVANGSTRLALLTAPGLGDRVLGDRIEINGVTFPGGVNRTWTVMVGHVSPGPYQLGTSRRNLPSGSIWVGPGSARRVGWLYAAPTQYLIIGLRNRQVGRPFRLTRGRRGQTVL